MISLLVAVVTGVIGTPLFVVMALSAFINHWRAGIDSQALIINFYQLAAQPMLKTLPLFSFAGYLLAYSGAPQRLLRLSRALLGWLPGGLAVVSILCCTAMTAFTGASGVTIVALGGLLLPALRAEGYNDRFSLGLVVAGGSLGLLFAPSLPIILYGVVAKTDIDLLFRAGLLPGLLVVLLLCAYSVREGCRSGVPQQAFGWAELCRAAWQARWELPLPAVVLGGIYGGFFSVSEASVIAAAYVLVAEVVCYRDVRVGQLGTIAREAMILVGGILIILGMTMAVTNYIIDAEIPTRLFNYLSPRMTSRLAFLVVLNIFLLVVGCMIDIYAAIVLVVPLITPIAAGYHVQPVHLGIAFLTNLGIGYCTPPVGLNLFIASIRFQLPIMRLYRAAWPFLLLLLAALVAVTYVPQLSLWLGGG